MHALQTSRLSLTPPRLFTSVDLINLQSVTASIFGLYLVSMCSWEGLSCTRWCWRILLERRQPNMSSTQTSFYFSTTVHRLSLALWTSSPFTTEVLCATRALYHVSGIKYFNFYPSLQLKSLPLVSSLIADSSNCHDVNTSRFY